MEGYVTRREYEEHNLRMEDEHKRQNQRLEIVEEAIKQNNKLLVSIEKLALNMQNMQKEQAQLRDDVEEIKNRDGQKWRKLGEDFIKIVLGILVGYIFTQLGIN